MKMTCARTTPDNRVAAWDRNSLFFIVLRIFTDQGKRQKFKVQSSKFKVYVSQLNPLLGGVRGGFIWVKDKRQK